MSREGGMHISSRLVSSTQKRQIMWNIIEPGDPYDIRKSMIARLPGRKNFMGEHLELVCLLQAAEIERISQYLDQYKLKFRQIQRRELDRHSYEIQIKQLTQQLSEEGNFKMQNIKLKEFLRKQTIEFEEMKKKSGGFEIELSRKYQDSLRQIESLMQENQMFKSNANKMRLDFQQALNSKSLENDELQRRLKQLSSSHSSEYSQKSQAFFKLQIEYKKLQFENKRIKELIDTKNKEIEELQAKSKQFIYQIQEMNSQLRNYGNINHTITQYQNRFSLLGQEIDRLNLVLREKTGQLSDAHNRIRLQEDDIKRKSEYINELERRKSELDQRYMQLEVKMVDSMKNLSGLDESRNLVKNYEINLQKLSGQIQRLNSVLRKKVQELEETVTKNRQYQYELKKIEPLKREIEEYRSKYGEHNKKFAEYQNKIALLSQEIERLNHVLRRKQDDLSSLEGQLKSKNLQIDSYQKKFYEIDIEYKSEINRVAIINQQYQSKINELAQENQFNRNKIQELVQQVRSSPSKVDVEKYYETEIERLTQIIQSKTAEVQRYEREKFNQPRNQGLVFEQEKQRIVQQYELQIANKNREIQSGRQTIAEYEKRIISSAQEIERLTNLLKKKSAQSSPEKLRNEELTLQLKKITEYENKLAIMNQQIERLNDNLRSKNTENKNLESRLRNYELELETSRKKQGENTTIIVSELQRKNAMILKENQFLKGQLARRDQSSQQTSSLSREYEFKLRQLSDEHNQIVRKASEYEFQITTLSQEIQRLNTILKAKVDENAELQKRIRTGAGELEDYRRRINEYEGKLSQINRQFELSRDNYARNAQYEIENYKRKIADLQTYNTQYQTRIRQYEDEIRVTRQERERTSGQINDQQRKFSQYENKIVILSQEIERLNDILAKFNNQNNQYKRKASEIDYLKSTIVTLEEKFSHAVHENQELRRGVNESNVLKTRISQDFEYKMRSLGQENEELLNKNRELESKLSYQSQEEQHLNTIIKSKIQEINTYDSKLRASYQENQSLNRKIQQLSNANRKIAEYDNKITILSQEIQRLNALLKLKVEETNNLQTKCRNYENEITNYQRKTKQYENTISRDLQTKITFISQENEDLKQKIRQLTGEVNKIPEFESKFAMVYTEVERLNTILRTKTEEIHTIDNKYRQAQQEIDKYRRRNEELEDAMHRELKNQSSVFEQRVNQLTDQNDTLRRNLRQLSDANRKIAEYQSKVVLLSKQIERLNEQLAKFSKQVVPQLQDKVRNLSYENEDLKRKLNELGDVNKGNYQLMSKIKLIAQENQQYGRRIQEYQKRISQVSNEVQRLNTVLRLKVEEVHQTELKLRQALSQNQGFAKKLRESSDVNRRIPQFQSKIAMLSQQIERLNGLLRSKVEEANSYQSELRNYKYEYETLQRRYGDLQGSLGEAKNNRAVLEQKVSTLNQENEQIRRTVRELSDSNRRISDYESRMTLLSQEIQRLNLNLRTKTEQRNSIQANFKNLKRDSENKINNLSNELEEYRRKAGENINAQASKIAEYENKILILSQQIQRLNYVLKEHTYEIEIIQKKQSQYLSEIERLNNTLRLKVEQTSRWEHSNNELKARLKSYEDNLQLANQEYQRLKQSHATLTEEYTKANKHLVEYQQSINKLYQQFQRLQAIMNDLKRQNYELKLKLQESGNLVDKNRALSAEIDRLTKIVDTQNKDLEELRLNLADQAALQKRIHEDMALMVVLFAEIESLRKRVKDTEIQIESVRRSSLAPFKV